MNSVTEKNIHEYRTIGATILRSFWSDSEVDYIEQAISDVAANPSPMVDIFEKDNDGNAIFFNDFNNWRRIASLSYYL